MNDEKLLEALADNARLLGQYIEGINWKYACQRISELEDKVKKMHDRLDNAAKEFAALEQRMRDK
jgi:hypothetical protein